MARYVLALLIGSAALAGGVGACSNDSSSDATDKAVSDVVFEGASTPKALTTLLAAQVQDDPSLAANFSWDSAGDELPLDPIPIFCWHIGSSTASSAPAPSSVDVPFLQHPNDTRKPAWNRAVTTLAHGLLDGVPEAHAAVSTNGLAYLLVFSTSKNPKLLRVFTTGTEYTPNQAAWDKITHTGELVHLRLTNASFDHDKIASGGGPFQGNDISFTFPVM